MKRKGLILVLCALMVGVLGIGIAQAGFYTCTVKATGVWGTVYYATLIDNGGAFPATNFFLPMGPVQNANYAACLTAWSNAGNVIVWLDNIAEWSTVATVACTK